MPAIYFPPEFVPHAIYAGQTPFFTLTVLGLGAGVLCTYSRTEQGRPVKRAAFVLSILAFLLTNPVLLWQYVQMCLAGGMVDASDWPFIGESLSYLTPTQYRDAWLAPSLLGAFMGALAGVALGWGGHELYRRLFK